MLWASKLQLPIFLFAIAGAASVLEGCYKVVTADAGRISHTGQVSHAADTTWLEINSANFENNLRILREKVLAANANICAVLKADAYGHGIELLMPSIIKEKVGAVCFTNNREARIARAKGFAGRLIRIKTPTPEEIEEVIDLNVEEMAGTLYTMQAISAIAQKHNKVINVHLNLNSAGMSRNGLDLDTELGKSEARQTLQLPNINVTGIMTHFPVEDVPGIQAGLQKFLTQANWLITEGKLDRSKVTLHSANTAATVQVPESHLDMVRVGSLLYGQNAPQTAGLKPVMEMKSIVASIHRFKKGDTVGYDKTFKLVRDSQLANLPIGYANGYNRAFSNRTQVLIRGKRYPVVGRVTMNTIMVDVTGAADIQPGDEVVLLGKQGNQEISIAELMAASYTFYGEFFVNVGNSNRKYLK